MPNKQQLKKNRSITHAEIKGVPPGKITSTVVQKLPLSHKKKSPEMAATRIPRVKPTKSQIKAVKDCTELVESTKKHVEINKKKLKNLSYGRKKKQWTQQSIRQNYHRCKPVKRQTKILQKENTGKVSLHTDK